jgi:putative ubiquitin-RnfH superfamily antitoxin RatB of RatAB toxin-antitoxin module
MIVEVAYALENEAFLKAFEVAENSKIEDVLKISNLLNKYPEIDLKINQVGIFGKVAKLSDGLRDKDRIEIYRPLIADPKEVRKRKALEKEVKRESKKRSEKGEGKKKEG